MNSLLFSMTLAVFLQCPDEEIVHFDGCIKNKIYITAVFEDNSRLAIPVINGLLPRIKRVRMSDGHVKRHLFYFHEEDFSSVCLRRQAYSLLYSLSKMNSLMCQEILKFSLHYIVR